MMKGTALSLFCVLTIAHASIEGLNKNGCPNDYSVEKLLPHKNCDQFYQCFHGGLITRFCSSGFHFNPVLNKCDWPADAKCDHKRESNENRKHDKVSYELDNSNPKYAHLICADSNSNGILVAHENCNQFYKCSYGKPIILKCAKNLLYNHMAQKCDWPNNVDCGDRVESVKEDSNDTAYDQSTDNASSDESGSNSEPSLAPVLCAAPGSEGILVSHENCNQFYKCSSGKPVELDCPLNLLYNPNKEYCDWPRNVECGERSVSENDESSTDDNVTGTDENSESNEVDEVTSSEGSDDTGTTGNIDPSQAPVICKAANSEGVLIAHENCNQFYKCSERLPVAIYCPGILLFNPSISSCDWPHNVDCGDRFVADSNNGENDSNSIDIETNKAEERAVDDHSDPSQAIYICDAHGSEGKLVAHENCNQFYKCHKGVPVALMCPGNLLYNPSKQYCDWPADVVCGVRVISNSDDNTIDSGSSEYSKGPANELNETGNKNSDPRQASYICAGQNSDGLLIAHENCNQFYKCFEGKPIVLFCQLNLLYNPKKEYCDWPYNVDCSGRVIPSTNNIIVENINTYAAVSSCYKSADGEIVPHENCSQFYKCLSGQRIAMDCPAGLYFNPTLKVCDWPMNVDCGDRLTEAQSHSKREQGRVLLRSLVQMA